MPVIFKVLRKPRGHTRVIMPTLPDHRMIHTNAALWGVAQVHKERSDLLCKYHGKACSNTRATKLNGELHRFCDEHRMRHNMFQRAYQKRRDHKEGQSKQSSNMAEADTVGTDSMYLDETSCGLGELIVIDLTNADSSAGTLTHEVQTPQADVALADRDVPFETVEELVQFLDVTEAIHPESHAPPCFS
jgi:hypothetical protein